MTFNVGYEVYDAEGPTRGVFLIEAATGEAAMQHAASLPTLQKAGKEGEDWNFLDVFETERKEGDIPVIVAR